MSDTAPQQATLEPLFITDSNPWYVLQHYSLWVIWPSTMILRSVFSSSLLWGKTTNATLQQFGFLIVPMA